ncbi:hypothetical protein QBC40DRAFT_273126 [Triangularia verruculosa]|uniref:Uncharacterized protein n=1 Tax=Triangularia verruculosa TaxID=2587418 RepID=A0AAN6XRB1_9PEZI|nr:hypothetical protein QBC40DRAFT_273126 [Triangularia verruculosa]
MTTMNSYRPPTAEEKLSMSPIDKLSKWLELKIYQLEVTMSVYMFTPMEKFIFYSILFLLTSLTLIATVLYLPHHIAFIVGRAWFYMHGEAWETAAAAAAGVTSSTIGKVVEATAGVVREL